MRIAMFTNTYLPHVGGVARSVKTFVEDLEYAGNKCLVVAPSFEGAEESDAKTLRIQAIQNFNGSDFSVRIPEPIKVESRLGEFKPDLIHSHHPFLLGDTALRYARARSLPIVFTHHTFYENYTHYVPLDSDMMKRLVVRMTTEYCNLVNHVVAPGKSVAEELAERGVETERTVIPTGVDRDLFGGGDSEKAQATRGQASHPRVLGHVGRLADEKNLPFLAEAVSLFMKEDEMAAFLIVGDGKARKKTAEYFSEQGLSERVVFTGPLTGKNLADAYRAMDIFLFASTSETQGMVLAEAMAAGTPVIALDASGAREIVKDGNNGFLLPDDSPAASFAESVGKFFGRSAEERGVMSENAAETAEKFSRERSAEKLSLLYRKILKESYAKTGRQNYSAWDEILNRIETEWKIASGKTSAVISALER